jgi:hypothetical protein
VADLLSSTRQQIEQRLAELRPLLAEVERLERALDALRGLEGGAAPAGVGAASRSASRPAARAPGRRRGAPPGRRQGATRANEFLALVRRPGGTSIPDAAERMGASPNYLYRVAATLQGEGLVEKRGRTWIAAGASFGAGGPPGPGLTGSTPADPGAADHDESAASGGSQPVEAGPPAPIAQPPGDPADAGPPAPGAQADDYPAEASLPAPSAQRPSYPAADEPAPEPSAQPPGYTASDEPAPATQPSGYPAADEPELEPSAPITRDDADEGPGGPPGTWPEPPPSPFDQDR